MKNAISIPEIAVSSNICVVLIELLAGNRAFKSKMKIQKIYTTIKLNDFNLIH